MGLKSNDQPDIRRMGVYQRFFKRPMDIVLSVIAMIFLSPLLLVVAILVRVKLGSPAIFRQVRPGLHEKLFTLYKFRTMTYEKDESGELLPDEIRLTRFGQLLRSTSLDELPELFNILKGDMSVLGPRPLLVQYLPLYDAKQKRRHDVRPGLSGVAQVSGRNATSWEERFILDVQYVDHISFIGDWKIIIRTLLKVTSCEGIYCNETSTAAVKPFMGTPV